MISHIVAASTNGVIGIGGNLPWDIPLDLKHFSRITQGKPIIMGRKTFDSIGRPLPRRMNIVLTSRCLPDGAYSATSIDQALSLAQKQSDDIFIIGGQKLFCETLALVDVIHLTRIHKVFAGDVYYPDVPSDFKLVSQTDHSDEPVPFSFLRYSRRR